MFLDTDATFSELLEKYSVARSLLWRAQYCIKCFSGVGASSPSPVHIKFGGVNSTTP